MKPEFLLPVLALLAIGGGVFALAVKAPAAAPATTPPTDEAPAAAAALPTDGPPSAESASAPRSGGTPTADSAGARLTDDELMDLVQRQTFRYFWDFAHPVSGLARERSNRLPEYGPEIVTTGGSGFGVMAIVVATERRWITREEAAARVLKLLHFLERADRFHGLFPHWMDGATGRTFPFSRLDDGADLVETSYLFEGLLTARQYFDRDEPGEAELRAIVTRLWEEADWAWHARGGHEALWWHWSPRHGFAMDMRISGWNEALIAYVLAASSPHHAIDAATYHHGWARDGAMANGTEYYGLRLPLGPPFGGPLFFAHYSFLGLDPRGLRDRYADYWQQNVNHTLINREYCVRNPRRFKGYGPGAWGLTSSDIEGGYRAKSPTRDLGVIAPTAALGSFPYTPRYSMEALRHFHDDLGARLWGGYGFADAFDESTGWVAGSYLAIDQGPIVVMIENHRTGLLWKLFMSCADVQRGLRTLGFESPYLR